MAFFAYEEMHQQPHHDPTDDGDDEDRPSAKRRHEGAQAFKCNQMRKVDQALENPNPGAACQSYQDGCTHQHSGLRGL